jgi:2-aminoadipate transaminase
VTQALVAEYTRRGLLESHLGHVIATYAGKAAAMQEGLERHLPPGRATWHTPEGGFFYWLRFPGLDSRRLFDRAIDENVAFVPGGAFVPDPDEQVTEVVEASEHARLCFTFADEPQIDEGCRRLARACEGP